MAYSFTQLCHRCQEMKKKEHETIIVTNIPSKVPGTQVFAHRRTQHCLAHWPM